MPYGSEWHLLRYLGRHRDRMNRRVQEATGGEVLGWLDHPWNLNGNPAYFDGPKLDAEWKGLEFLAFDNGARQAWTNHWPQTGNVQNWDALGWIRVGAQVELLLVEAKAHLGELKSSCGAAEHGGLPTIRLALDEAKADFGVQPTLDWLAPYYQFCNRLSVLQFLTRHGVGARLLFLYFCGDTNPHAQCPNDADGWMPSLLAMKQHVGLTGQSSLEGRVHEMFLPVIEI